MVRFLKRGYSLERLRGALGRKVYGQSDEDEASRSQASEEPEESGAAPTAYHYPDDPPKFGDDGDRRGHPTDMELMQEKFAKLLLGEDMSGGGIGVASALALSNAITNLAASVFGEQRRLEPMSLDRKERWRREIEWLLSVTDHIVEFVPSKQVAPDGSTMEVMITQQRKDLRSNLPPLRKLDRMLIENLDTFNDQNEFSYVSRDADESEKGNGVNAGRNEDKWWLPQVKVPPNGLSEAFGQWLQYQKDLVHQALKAAMAINSLVLAEMEIPDSYIDSLPKHGRESLGDSLYKSITDDVFDPDAFLSSVDLSTEHKIVDLKNKIEASVVIWTRKMHNRENSKSTWGSAVKLEKRGEFEERAETILLIFKHRFPGISQSDLDICKIQYNKDVGHAILESYSRVIESLASTVMSRIEDVLHADAAVKDDGTTAAGARKRASLADDEPVRTLDAKAEIEKLDKMDATLQEFMGWQEKEEDAGKKEKEEDAGKKEKGHTAEHGEGRWIKKLPNLVTNRKNTYIEKIENWGGFRSPNSRH